jgi:GNAT superfamily N-acetyltransferase
MDTLVYYCRSVSTHQALRPLPEGVTCREADVADAPDVAALALVGFSQYVGHYHTDPRLDSSAADAAYAEWAETSTARADATSPVLLVQIEGRTVGFLTLRATSDEEIELVLSAVDPASRLPGVYAILIARGVSWAAAHGYTRVVTSTQVNNYSVQSVWTRLGFRLDRCLHTFHKWF